MLEVDVGVELEAGLELGDDISGTLEGVVDVMAGLEVAGFVGEFAASELGDLVDLGSFGFEVLGNGFDKIVNAAFKGLRIKYDQALVFAAHWIEVGVVW
jgi:hypothetical protein